MAESTYTNAPVMVHVVMQDEPDTFRVEVTPPVAVGVNITATGPRGPQGIQGKDGNVCFATFDVEEDMCLYMNYPEIYDSVMFGIGDDGCLEVKING